jgi:hypothetical protein
MTITRSQFKEAIFPLRVEKLQIDGISAMEMADKMWEQFRDYPEQNWHLPKGISVEEFAHALKHGDATRPVREDAVGPEGHGSAGGPRGSEELGS